MLVQQRGKALPVGQDVDLDDPAVPDGELADGERHSVVNGDLAHPPVDHGQMRGAGQRGERARSGDHGRRAAHQPGQPGDLAAVGPQHHLGVEQFEQRVEVAAAGRREERLDDLAVAPAVRLRLGGRVAHPAAGAAGELPGRGRGPLDNGRDVLERHGEHVVQHEREAFGGAQGVEDDEEREAHRVREQGFLFGVGGFPAARQRADLRVGHVGSGHVRVGALDVQGLLAALLARPQQVEADAAHDGREPAAQVLHALAVGAAELQPGLLDGVLGLAQGAEHAVGDGLQAGPVLLEPLRQKFSSVHVTFLRRDPS
ncbi:hypothetical protein STRAU_7570 [Streptomyces aurantiacus JA 4570]|uniref:Uncharacterized protein n=1 Tax=Streptomyces aurantiacus JA 4570 TaxID=1286094 RepID=S3Z9V8_9ACTN|nr:hypothetical protein STRAU_7570 [Streptomyces aurantiacus JA 4570]